jgi:hypothetical protein
LHNGEDTFAHTTKQTDYQISKPRYVIFGAAVTHKVIKHLNSEQKLDENADAFFSRMFVLSPEPIYKRIGIKLIIVFFCINH